MEFLFHVNGAKESCDLEKISPAKLSKYNLDNTQQKFTKISGMLGEESTDVRIFFFNFKYIAIEQIENPAGVRTLVIDNEATPSLSLLRPGECRSRL